MPYSDYPPGTIAARGKEIYAQQVRHKVEPQHKGKIVAIDIQTGDYEIGDNDLKAIKHLLAKRPGSIIYSLRIGVGPVYGIGFNFKANTTNSGNV